MDSNLNEPILGRRKCIGIKSTQVFLVAAIVLMTLVITVLCIGFLVRYEVQTDVWNVDSVSYWKDGIVEEQKFWYDEGIEELKAALKISWELEDARNVIVFVAHGIGQEALAGVRFKENSSLIQELVWDDFSHIGNLLTHCRDTVVCDINTLGTALFGGVRTTQGVGGLDSAVSPQNCTQSLTDRHHVKSIFEMAQESGMRTGFVTTGRVSGPLMASLYAHTSDTSWECDSAVPPGKQLQGCTDIATQMIDDETGMNMNVIMGGGRQTLVSAVPTSTWDPLDSEVCNSQDGRNYLRDWRTLKRLSQRSNALVQTATELNKLNGANVDFVLGVFANGDIKRPQQINTTENHMPDLADMVGKSLEVLKRDGEGFLLVVESGNGLSGTISDQVEELMRLNMTMEKAMKNLSADTLLITIFMEETGVENSTVADGTTEGNGTNKKGFIGDIKVLAKGPSSHLLHGLHEDTYLAHAIAFTLKIGTFRKLVK